MPLMNRSLKIASKLALCFSVGVDAACSGYGLGAEEWEYVEYLANVATHNPLPRDAKQVLFDFLRMVEQNGGVALAVASCPWEMVTLLAQSLTSIEFFRGEKALLDALDQAAAVKDLISDGDSQLAWAEGIVHVMRGYGDAQACKLPGALRVFVYDTGRLAERSVHCSAGMEGVEVFFHRYFLSSACRTDDPRIADLFFVPFYSFCYQNDNITPGNETAELDAINIQLVASLAHFHGNLKPKHMFIFPHEFWDFPSWRDLVADSHLLVVEANPLEWSVETQQAGGAPVHCLNCFSGAKDIVLPGHTDYWTTRQLLELQKPWLERQYKVCYHGAFSHHLYDSIESAPPFNTTAGMTRAALARVQDEGMPGVSIGGHLRPVRNYYERITDCQYCFVPKGVGFTNGRLMETFFSGCVAVILSDAMVVPFDTFLPWPSFSLKLRMPRTFEDALAIVQYLLDLPLASGYRMHLELAKYRCWFDYGPNAKDDCSPYVGVLQSLMWQTRASIPRHFWAGESTEIVHEWLRMGKLVE